MTEKIRDMDEWIRRKAEEEAWDASESCREHVECILERLPELSGEDKRDSLRISEKEGKISGVSGQGNGNLSDISEREDGTFSDATDRKERRMKKIRSRRTAILAAAAAALMGMTAMASGLFGWHEKAVENFKYPTEEEQNAMTMEGLAREQTVSVTDAGITITAEQTVQDKNTLYILLDIQAEDAIIDGNGGFDNPDENGEYGRPWILTEEEDAFDNVSMGFSPDTPSYGELSGHGYYEISALKSMEKEWTEDAVTVRFTEYSYYTYENGETIPHKVAGDWTLILPLGEDTILETEVYEPKEPVEIAGMPVMVKRIELSPLSLRLVYDMDDRNRLEEAFYADEEDFYVYETEFAGFLGQNGQVIEAGIGGMSGKYDHDNREIICQMGLDRYVDVEQVSAVLLGRENVPVPLK